MGKLERKNLKVFAENATLNNIGQFGSAKATTKLNTKDIETIQGLEAWQNGWQDAVISNKNYPPLEEMNGAMNVLSYQTAYTLQEGIPEWDSKTTYYKGSIVKSLNGDTIIWYQSIIDENLNRALSDSTAWEVTTPANTDLSNLSTTGQAKFDAKADKTYVDNELTSKANISLNNLDDVGADKLNTSKMYTTGGMSEDTQGFEQLKTMKHSTFDLSKFPVVGSPTITDDGIASGFSSSKYLNTGYILNPDGDWSVRVKFRTRESMVNQHIVAAFPNQYSGLVIQLRRNSPTDTRIRISIGNGSDGYLLQVNSDNIVDKINTDFDVEVNYLSGVYSFIVNGVTVKTLTSSDKMVSTGEIIIGKSPQWNEPFLGSVDLKYFSITVDGREVFSGNKTGIDIIKADDYEVVGSPVISDDGVASGFSTSNYLRTSTIDFTKPWKIVSYFKISNNNSHKMLWAIQGGGWFDYIYIFDTVLFTFKTSDNVERALRVGNLQPDIYYTNVVGWDGQIYYNELYGNGILSSRKTLNSNLPLNIASGYIQLGYGSNGNYILDGSIDLNAFKIYVDGNLVYQPCLKIPYTESKTGSKIVDEVYRDRVIDLYEQEGQAGYYTIDEENKNFTLPMGEIYGMIESKGSSIYQPPLLSTMWSDHLLNDMSWLRADTFSWQDGTVYSQAYNELLAEYNDSASSEETEGTITFKRTPKGYKIALATQETAIVDKYTTDGIAWYYILDTTNKKFKLPRTKFGFEGLRTSVGDYIEAGLPTHKHYEFASAIDGTSSDNNTTQQLRDNMQVNSLWYSGYGSYVLARTNSVADVGLSSTPDNSIYGNSDTVQPPATQMYLYFYVGNFTKSAEAQTAGLKAELLNGKVDTSSLAECQVIIDTYKNGTSGYRIWSDGYCVQWGIYTSSTPAQREFQVNLLKNFINTSYTLTYSSCLTDSHTADFETKFYSKTTSSFKCYLDSSGGSPVYPTYTNWKACGYLAEGEY